MLSLSLLDPPTLKERDASPLIPEMTFLVVFSDVWFCQYSIFNTCLCIIGMNLFLAFGDADVGILVSQAVRML